MYIDRILYPVYSLGPGERMVIWFAGCPRRCLGCANPELQTRKETQKIGADALFEQISVVSETRKIEGFTLTGGEPFEQSEELALLLPKLKCISDDILIYSGYTLKEIQATPSHNTLLHWTTALIDGPYIDSLNDGTIPLRGSTNQTLHIFDATKKALYDEYLSQGRLVQNYLYKSRILSVGIHGIKE